MNHQSSYGERLQGLRTAMAKQSLAAYLVPMADAFQSEYLPSSDARIAHLCGFTGSAGFIVVTEVKAAFFTDGRYTLQAANEVDATLFEQHNSSVLSPGSWLKGSVDAGGVIGFDPWLHTAAEIDRLQKVLGEGGITLRPIEENLVDLGWKERPESPCTPVVPHDLLYAGKASRNKRMDVADTLRLRNMQALFLADPASVAWLLNIRGQDTPNTPLALSYALVDRSGDVVWYIDPRKITRPLADLVDDGVIVEPLSSLCATLTHRLAEDNASILLDPNQAPYALVRALEQANIRVERDEDPTLLSRAMKNRAEQEGMRMAHRRDGVALVSFMAWLATEIAEGRITQHSEMSVAEKLAEFRAQQAHYSGPSFDTIAGFAAHGAIVHYRATAKSNSVLGLGQLLLLDSGGQYHDGTTDVTRTLGLGEPTAAMRNHYTRVLRGHIALSAIHFPDGTTGGDLDVLARAPLWQVGLDYAHGTGHGVGSYLGVHEGPQSVSRRSRVPLKTGMVLSNEPGYYAQGRYGIRIENLQMVMDPVAIQDGDIPMRGFEVLTVCPYDRSLMNADQLSPDEKLWINTYHERVYRELSPYLDPAVRTWLMQATAPL